MGRKKILMDFIKDDRKRMSTFEKRRIGLFKKARELSKLCGVNIIVKIINRKSLYQFSDSNKGLLDDRLHDFPIVENFTNDSFQEYLSKKMVNQKTCTDPLNSECQSGYYDSISNISDEDELDTSFYKVLQEKQVFKDFLEIKRHDDCCEKVTTNGNCIASSCELSIATTNQPITENRESSINDGPLHSFNSNSSLTSDILTLFDTKENPTYPMTNPSPVFTYGRSFVNDLSTFEGSLTDIEHTNPNVPNRLEINRLTQSDLNTELDTPTLDFLLNNQVFSILSGFESESAN